MPGNWDLSDNYLMVCSTLGGLGRPTTSTRARQRPRGAYRRHLRQARVHGFSLHQILRPLVRPLSETRPNLGRACEEQQPRRSREHLQGGLHPAPIGLRAIRH